MKHRPDLKPGGLHLPEAVLDDPHALIAKGDIGDRERVVIGGQDELAIKMLGSFDLVLIEIGSAFVIEAEIAAVALGGDQTAGRFGVILFHGLKFGLQLFQDVGPAAIFADQLHPGSGTGCSAAFARHHR